MFDEQPDDDPHGECAAEIHRLESEVVRLRTALNEVVFSCRTKLNMKDVARKALFDKPNYLNKGDDHASSDPPDQQ